MFGAETIDRFLHTSYGAFAGRATITLYLPLLAERFAKQRLKALARVAGKAGTGIPTVPFLCVHNAWRSQMPLGFLQHLAKDIWRQIWSNNPNERLNPEIRRRTDVVGIFPNRESAIRLVGAVLAEQHDEWAEMHRYTRLDVFSRARLSVLNTADDTTIPEVTTNRALTA